MDSGLSLVDGGYRFLELFPRDVEELHLAGKLGEDGLEKRLTSCLLDMSLRIFRYEIAEAALVEDDAFLSELVVGLDRRVGVDTERGGIFAHAGYAVEGLVDTREDLVAQAVGYLQIDGFIIVECHINVFRVVTGN